MVYAEYRRKAVLTVQEIREILRLGRNKTYEFLSGEDCPFPVIRLGRQLRIPTSQFFEWLDGMNAEAS